MNSIASLPYWFDEDVVAAKLHNGTELEQRELDALVCFYMNYRHNDTDCWNAFVTVRGRHYKIRYHRVDGEYVYEQPEVI